jgi:nicotinate phosphoribosyltransferase
VGTGLLTDLYELTMAASYLRRGMTEPATFSLFARTLPPDRGFLVAAGLERLLAMVEAFAFDEADLAWLAGHGFEPDAVDAFSRLRFTGDIWAVPEGRVVFPDEPLLEVTGPLPEAQLIETIALNQVTYQTALATKAARCQLAAAGRASLVDFSLRRTQGIEAGMAAARAGAIAGFAGTSNVEAARTLGVTAVGTMAHSYIEAFPDERAAFRAFAQDFPGRGTTFLVDTYDTLTGVENALKVADELELEGRLGVRLDSGDLLELSRAARRVLDGAGRSDVTIVASGGLDEFEVERLLDEGAPIDLFGVGTRVGVSADAPSLDTAYKLVEYGGRPVMKLSPGKETRPGPKQVHRRQVGSGDLLATRSEPVPDGHAPLLVPVMESGARLGAAEPLSVLADRLRADLQALPAPLRQLRASAPPPVPVSARLEALTRSVRAASRRS